MNIKIEHIHGNKYLVKYESLFGKQKFSMLIDHVSGKMPDCAKLATSKIQTFLQNINMIRVEDYIDFQDFTGTVKIKIDSEYQSQKNININLQNGKPHGHYPSFAISLFSPSSRTIKYFADNGKTVVNEPSFISCGHVRYTNEINDIYEYIINNSLPIQQKINTINDESFKIYSHKENPLYNYKVHERFIFFSKLLSSKKFYKDLTLFSDEDEVLLKYYEANLS